MFSLLLEHIPIHAYSMKTTIDLPDEILHRAKVVAAQRSTTLKQLFISGLELVMKADRVSAYQAGAVERLRRGLRLGGCPLTRDQSHERH